MCVCVRVRVCVCVCANRLIHPITRLFKPWKYSHFYYCLDVYFQNITVHIIVMTDVLCYIVYYAC